MQVEQCLCSMAPVLKGYGEETRSQHHKHGYFQTIKESEDLQRNSHSGLTITCEQSRAPCPPCGRRGVYILWNGYRHRTGKTIVVIWNTPRTGPDRLYFFLALIHVHAILNTRGIDNICIPCTIRVWRSTGSDKTLTLLDVPLQDAI